MVIYYWKDDTFISKQHAEVYDTFPNDQSQVEHITK